MKTTSAVLVALSLLMAEVLPVGAEVGNDHFRIGTTYSHKQSEYLSLDARETFDSILDLGFDLVRLGAYWDDIEKKEGEYDFSILDWQIAEAKAKNKRLVLTVGMKAPRWPEYFIPSWVLKHVRVPFTGEISRSEFLREKTLKFIEAVVEHYKDEKAIQYWQVENEAMDRSGPQLWWIGHDFLAAEVSLVRKIDNDRRLIILTTATYPNKLLYFMARSHFGGNPILRTLPLCDILGVNIYPAVGHRFWRFKMVFWTKPEERQAYFTRLLKAIHRQGKQAWIMELQAEPWDPGVLVHTAKGPSITANPQTSRASFEEFRQLGFETIFLWGAEYWRFRHLQHQDNEWWDSVKRLLSP